MALAGQVAIVTGASRGIGRGIALQLGEAGAKVYITGRRPKENAAPSPYPTLEAVANEITTRGGQGIARFVDHSDQNQVSAFFDDVAHENDGALDILVNNAYSAVHELTGEGSGKKFWELEPEFYDLVNEVGLRNHYFCSIYAARLMVPRKRGLIVNVSSMGGLKYLFNTAYGVGKQALDRLSADTGYELRPKGVTVVSLWPGAVRTEIMTEVLANPNSALAQGRKQMAEVFRLGETTEFAGKAVVGLAKDPKKLEKTGRILITSDLAREYGFVDIDGRSPPSARELWTLLYNTGHTTLAHFFPSFIRLPGWMITASASKL